uniref:ADAM metallopeptidase domain 3 n=1 Tax=Nannospalax galili TaxID=1026970 RepID=A0A8C6RMC5_NANGA
VRIEDRTYTLLDHSFLQLFFFFFFVFKKIKKQSLPKLSLKRGHCFYQGHAAEMPISIVTVSTCSGLRGLLQLEDVTYGIEPLESSATFEHMFYEIKNNKIDYAPLKEKHENQSYRILVKPEVSNPFDHLHLCLTFYDYMGSEMGAATQKVVHIFGLINTMFSQLKMMIMLTSLEIWSDKNKISTNGDADEVLQNFLSWKQKNANGLQKLNEMTYLLLYMDLPAYIGATYRGTACNPKFSAGIAVHLRTLTIEALAVVLAQLLGIHLGLTYDDVYNCFCPGSTCIMNPEAIHSHGIKIFSSCSMSEYKQLASQPESECLQQQQQQVLKVVAQPQMATCGNNKLEVPEECDCGPAETCTHVNCCDPKDCTLIKSAECGTGPCCDKRSCLIAERGKLCRKSKDLCDFPEFCNGSSEYCVPDTQAADLEPCNNGTAFCYKGICRDPDRQCAELFGKYAKGSNYQCSQEVNMQNDKFGNCRGRCNSTSLFCGKIVCHWSSAKLVHRKDFDVQYTYLGGKVCISAHIKIHGEEDLAYVADGTVCGDEEVCLQGYCRSVHSVPKHSNCSSVEKCQGHGICNNLDSCQCEIGFAPPECDMTPSSPGGSLDDGFWLPIDKSTPLIVKRRGTYKKGLLISFYIFLPFLLIIAVIVVKRRTSKRFWHREALRMPKTILSLLYRSVTEDSNKVSN